MLIPAQPVAVHNMLPSLRIVLAGVVRSAPFVGPVSRLQETDVARGQEMLLRFLTAKHSKALQKIFLNNDVYSIRFRAFHILTESNGIPFGLIL